MTTRRWSVAEAVAGRVRHGIPSIGLWREHVAEQGLAETVSLVREARLRVSSPCRGGFFTRPGRREDDRRAVDEAAACLVLVPGGPPPGSRDLAGARSRVAEALSEPALYAADRGVPLAVEPMHPPGGASASACSRVDTTDRSAPPG